MFSAQDVTVVIATRNRTQSLMHTLDRLCSIREKPQIIVLDNHSDMDPPALGSDHSKLSLPGLAFIENRYPQVQAISLSENLGAAARNIGVQKSQTQFVAFSDDDSWWHSGSLALGVRLFNQYPRLAAIAAQIRVMPKNQLDPTCLVMANSPVPSRRPIPGKPVLGFVACGALVRRDAFLSVGGFERRFLVGGEEELFSIDLYDAGWDLAYVEDLIAYHAPFKDEGRRLRGQRQLRNALWCAWLRRPWASAVRQSFRLVRQRLDDPQVRGALFEALKALPWVIQNRRVISPELEAALAALESERI